MWLVTVPRAVTTVAAQQLANVDYTVANRVTEDVARVVSWAYAHDLPWLARDAIHLLQDFDFLGSVLIALAVWLADHTR